MDKQQFRGSTTEAGAVEAFSDRLMTPREVADRLVRSVPALAQMRYRGTGPKFIHAGGRIRYRESAVEAWLNTGEKTTT
ncbi:MULTISPECIES: AlpA family transcriptional regulator [Microbacterium]|uniref:helix-turn-helix transcriptional regulator n=1 Tax=Microbacterium TaxID=33882 RepID=UPI00277D99AA|nr:MULTISPECIES: helix-turn-helix domain-containing protein [Microbacterium]MDQ1083911.1 putative DNA-binding transcriptional regulator AlpA [Microbacterium sp. SORGH_AS_0344]MDQ1170809.1 putative DNA-binding transcriptional regulator AlpA [Microbacterium proteolyticum]